jgi:hypothetical protein
MNDGWAVAMAVATAVGAWATLPVPRWLGALVVVVALVARRPALLCVGAALLATALSVAAWAGTAPVRAAPFDGVVTLVTDPEPRASGVRAEVRAGTRHLEAWAHGAAAAALGARQAGERLAVVGTTGPAPSNVRRRLAEQHIAGQLQIQRVGDHDDGDPASRAANRVGGPSSTAPAVSTAERAFSPGSCWATTGPSRPTWSTTSAPPASVT